MNSPVRRLPALLLLAVLALLPLQAWFRAVQPEVILWNPADGIRSVTWAGTVMPDGRLAVALTYDLGDDQPREVDVRLPENAHFVAADGVPLAADIGLYATTTARGRLTVTYELPDAIVRYDDGALLDLTPRPTGSGSFGGDRVLFPCAVCYVGGVEYGNVAVYGALFVTEASSTQLALSHLGDVDVEVDDVAGVVRFVGSLRDVDAVAMVARLDASAVPDAPVSAGSAATTFEELREAARDAGQQLRAPSLGSDAKDVTTALVLTAMFAALLAWIVFRFATASRRRAAEDAAAVDAATEDPAAARSRPIDPHSLDVPSPLEPALAGLVVGGEGPGDRSIVAGTLLMLAHRGVVTIDGIDSQRFTLRIPSGATGTTVIEEAVLGHLRPQGQVDATATITGPPLWGPDGPEIARSLAALTTRHAMSAGLLRTTLSLLILLPFSLAMGIVALIGSGGLSVLGWIAAIGGPFIAVFAALLSGVSLTRRGRRERAAWIRYGDLLRTNPQLARVGAPAVATWGEVLAYAAVLGAAPTAARALSPRSGE